MYLRNGYLVIKRSGAPPILIHWTVLAVAIIIGSFRFQPGSWLGFFVIILVHELGHAAAVWKARATVTEICMDGTGGHCEWEGSVTRRERLAIVWGGVLAQFLLWGIAFLVSLYTDPFSSVFSAQFFDVLLRLNLIIAALNLLPVKPLDGHDAWRLLRLVWEDWRRHKRIIRRAQLSAKTVKKMEELKRLEGTLTPNPEVKEMVNQIIQRAIEDHKAKNQVSENKED